MNLNLLLTNDESYTVHVFDLLLPTGDTLRVTVDNKKFTEVKSYPVSHDSTKVLVRNPDMIRNDKLVISHTDIDDRDWVLSTTKDSIFCQEVKKDGTILNTKKLKDFL